ncbi:aspartate aminotransferase family protein [Candidatus Woesearchaeota archaeon]|nr:aspartate aminotransferase family protein [Candidatus Woesearchaeota archaeon]
MNTRQVIGGEREFLMSTYTRPDFVLEHGRGCYVWDKEGKKYLDFIGGIGSCLIGHGDIGLAKVLEKQSKKLINTTNLFYTEPQVELAKKLVKLSGLSRVFLSNSGTEANECAIKLARKHTKKSDIITVRFAFHGRTFGSMAGTWDEKYKKDFQPHLPGFVIVNENEVESAITENTAAVMIEPIQGEAGVRFFREGYFKQLREICNRHNILLILDEVQTGNGRTGKFFAYQSYGIKPDIVTLAKGLANGVPIGATITGKGINFTPGSHGSTFGGNCLASSAALHVISVVEKKKLMENARKMGAYFSGELRKLKSPCIKEVRGLGLMIGVELNITGKEIVGRCAEKGLLVNCAHERTLRFLPPLTATKKEIDKCVGILGQVL